MEDTTEIVEITNVVPLKHQLGKLFVGTMLAFAASKLGEKAYDRTLAMIKTRTTTNTVG